MLAEPDQTMLNNSSSSCVVQLTILPKCDTYIVCFPFDVHPRFAPCLSTHLVVLPLLLPAAPHNMQAPAVAKVGAAVTILA